MTTTNRPMTAAEIRRMSEVKDDAKAAEGCREARRAIRFPNVSMASIEIRGYVTTYAKVAVDLDRDTEIIQSLDALQPEIGRASNVAKAKGAKSGYYIAILRDSDGRELDRDTIII